MPGVSNVNGSLDATTFLLPIITPAFFRSDACREELERFLKREEELQRGDLILPVYYVSCPVLSDKAKQERDKLAQVIAARQYADWRELRFEEFASSQCRRAFAKLAEQLMEALERSQDMASVAVAARIAETAKATPPPEPRKKDGKEAASSFNTFQSKGGEQNIAQGSNAIGTQNNYYGPQVPIEAMWQLLKKNKPQPASSAKTKPPTIIADPFRKGDYITITDALKAAKPSTRILVRPGLYREYIMIYNSVEIVGEGHRDNIIIEAYGKQAVIFKAEYERIANLTIRQIGGGKWHCIDIAQGMLDLEDCDISSQSDACIAIHSEAAPRLYHNRINNGIGEGVVVLKGGKGRLEHNEIIANARDGVMICESGCPTLHYNRISENGYAGIRIFSGGDGIFENNDLRDNPYGAWFIAPDCEARVQRRGNIE